MLYGAVHVLLKAIMSSATEVMWMDTVDTVVENFKRQCLLCVSSFSWFFLLTCMRCCFEQITLKISSLLGNIKYVSPLLSEIPVCLHASKVNFLSFMCNAYFKNRPIPVTTVHMKIWENNKLLIESVFLPLK